MSESRGSVAQAGQTLIEGFAPEQLRHLYRSMLLPRMIEEKMLVLLRQGRLSKWFSGIGQEAIAAAGVKRIPGGIVGDAAFSAPFGQWLHDTFELGDRASEITATAMVVISITFVTPASRRS